MVIVRSSSRPRLIVAEFIYSTVPVDARARAVYAYALRSRFQQLTGRDTVLWLCADHAAAHSVTALVRSFGLGRALPQFETHIVNPPPFAGVPEIDTPRQLAWELPQGWTRLTMTDRWARILAALERAAHEPGAMLAMPAHDAVWGAGLLERLIRFSQRHARAGLGAAVSPYTYWQHSPVPGVDIPEDVIRMLNAAFNRDVTFRCKLWRDQVQGVWGKMSLIPAGMCAGLRVQADTTTLEDDLILDGAVRRLGYAARALWIENPRQYRQALPAFDAEAVRRVIARTLHYSLNVYSPAHPFGGSALAAPLDVFGRLRTVVSPRFRRINAAAERLIRAEADAVQARMAASGASWVDWGAYRIVVRRGDPSCEVWKRSP
ncbi:MAG: hypothetical protein SF162_09405 [bacterium]|nr:hypothetical protein [bacterium]